MLWLSLCLCVSVVQSLCVGETATTALLKNLAILSLFFLHRGLRTVSFIQSVWFTPIFNAMCDPVAQGAHHGYNAATQQRSNAATQQRSNAATQQRSNAASHSYLIVWGYGWFFP
jgi:hypothetical protein